MQKIRILHVIKSLGRGGAEMLLPETLKLHDPSRFEFHYAYFLPWKNQMVGEIEKAGGKVICFPASYNLKLLGKTSAVIKYCRKNNIDLIHCHLPWSGFLGRMVYYKTEIPVIYTEHNIQERYHQATKWLNKLSFNSQSLALGVSNDVTRSIEENIKPEIPVKTVLNGVNTNRFVKDFEKGKEIKKRHNIPENALIVGNIAVFRQQKSIPDWLRAFHLIQQQEPDVYGILVGAGPQEEEIKKLAAELKLTERLRFAGLQTNTVDYFSAMDVFMMSSAFEGLPIALLEAMSMECGIVSTKAGGVVEVVRDEIDGLLCEVSDDKCLAEKSLKLLTNSTLRRKMQFSARERVMNSFSLKRMVEELEVIYSDHVKK